MKNANCTLLVSLNNDYNVPLQKGSLSLNESSICELELTDNFFLGAAKDSTKHQISFEMEMCFKKII